MQDFCRDYRREDRRSSKREREPAPERADFVGPCRSLVRYPAEPLKAPRTICSLVLSARTRASLLIGSSMNLMGTLSISLQKSHNKATRTYMESDSLSQALDGLESLPAMLQRNYGLIRELDTSLQASQRQNEERCDKEIEELKRGIESGSLPPEVSLVRFSDEVLDEQKHCIRIADEKVSLANQAYDVKRNLLPVWLLEAIQIVRHDPEELAQVAEVVARINIQSNERADVFVGAMGSLSIYASPNVCESRNQRRFRTHYFNLLDFTGNSVYKSKFSFSLGVGRNKSVHECYGLKILPILVSGLEGDALLSLPTELDGFQPSEEESVALVEGGLALKNPVPWLGEINNKKFHKTNNVRKGIARKILNRVHANKTVQCKGTKTFSMRSANVTRYNTRFGDILANVTPECSIDHCNSILKLLERRNDNKTIYLFEWMKTNGKLKKNATAYNMALRALARKEDWSGAKLLLEEMTADSGCELSAQSFNGLIYVCAKKGIAGWGMKWFRLMLDKGVQPNVATIGMLMGLYQKTCNLAEAEFTFSCMRGCKLQCLSAYSSMITMYTRLCLYGKSEEIIRTMDKDGLLPNLDNWLVRLNAYSQQGKLEEAELVLKSMKEAGFVPNIVAYNTLITGYGRISNTKAAENVFQSLKCSGLEPDETTYRSMIEGSGRADKYEDTLWYYEQLKKSGFQPNSSNFYTIINLQASHGDEGGVVQTLKDMKEMGCQYPSMLSSLLQAYKRAERIEIIPSILQDCFYEDILHDPASSSILVMAYVQNGLHEEALKVLQCSKWVDSDFEENLYHLLICSCKEEGQYENAIEIYKRMPTSDHNPNIHVACTMIDIYCAVNRFNDAENLYLKLKSSGINFDMIAYSVVVRMYIKAGSLKDACIVLNTMEKQKDIVPDAFLFRDMLRTYQRCSMLEKSANAYYWMLKCGVRLDEAMYNCIINCCGHALPIDEVSRLFDEMLRCGYTANTITCNVMLDIYRKNGLLTKARKIFSMARKHGLADAITYNTMIAAYGQNKDFKSMKFIVQRMEISGYPVSLEAYNSMLDAYGKEDLLDEFNDVLKKMKRASCSSDHYTYNIMMNIYGKKGWIEEVSQVLAELKEHGLEPDLYSYNTLIKAYGIAGMIEEAVNMVREMRSKGVEPDRVTYTNLIAALQRNENFLEAYRLTAGAKYSFTPFSSSAQPLHAGKGAGTPPPPAASAAVRRCPLSSADGGSHRSPLLDRWTSFLDWISGKP
ncbi:Pentatricopeptide repeat-containing protein [Apostasia shenzhenica]|uniref:Pentatricopeptide repeat-containing protein n=1 Tax=Apostasia shenzhenica TaxID=1088818 RepID=A0A2I0BCG5_9ASPA|nr:Pentatricopeptide repeat-containing protein [Apostasia shenzhenica]